MRKTLDREFSHVSYANGWFWLTGGSVAFRSADGERWEKPFRDPRAWPAETDLPEVTEFDDRLGKVRYGPYGYMMIKDLGHLLVTPDGNQWSVLPVSSGLLPEGDMAYGAGRFVVAGWWGELLASEDGVNWTRVDETLIPDPVSVKFVGGQFILNARLDGGYLNYVTWTSLDGRTWSRAPTVPPEAAWAVYGAGRWVAQAQKGGVWISADGRQWEWVQTGIKHRGIVYGNGRFLSMTEDGTLAMSLDGIAWTTHAAPPGDELASLSFVNDRFLAEQRGGEPGVFGVKPVIAILSSFDGITWEVLPTSGPGLQPRIITYGNGRYVAYRPVRVTGQTDPLTGSNIAQFGLSVSSNLKDWQDTLVLEVGSPIITFGDFINGQFMFADTQGSVYTSLDGVHWQVTAPRQRRSASWQIAYGNGRYVHAGEMGVLVADGPGYAANNPPVPSPDIGVLLNGEPVPVEVVVLDGRSLVPVRAIAELMGAEVRWQPESRTAEIVQGEREIRLTIGVSEAAVDGERILLDTPPVIWADRTHVPLRFIVETLGGEVRWSGASRTVEIFHPAI